MVMSVNSLNIFITVVEKGSFTEAAKVLYISQPAISKAISGLEKDLNIRLFQRDKRRGLLLTNVGEKILPMARQMLDLENKIYQIAFKENNFLGGRVRIASIPVLSTTILPRAIAEFKEKYPYVSIELIEGDARWVKKQVIEHVADFGLSLSPFDDLEHKVLVEDEMVAISNTPIPKTVDLLNDEALFIFGKAGEEAAVDLLKKNHAIKYDSWFTVARGETVVGMVEQGIGMGIISKFTLEKIPNHLKQQKTSPEIFLKYAAVANSFDDLTPVSKEFIRLMLSQKR